MNFFNRHNIKSPFSVCYNLLPHYSAAGQNSTTIMKCVADAWADGRIESFFLSDYPANPQNTSTLQLAEKIQALGGEPIISLALTYDDRHTVIKKINQYCRAGVHRFLFVSGEHPKRSGSHQPEPLYDLDCVQLLMQLRKPNSIGPPENLNIGKGCAVSPFKKLESEQVWQYEKLKRKVKVGADFAITQVGYDIRKFDELVRFCRLRNISIPLVANIFITDLQTANLYRQGHVPGVTIPDRLLQTLSSEASDPQQARKKMCTRSAKTLAVLQGLGYNGVLIGYSSPDFATVRQVLDEAEGMRPEWRNFLDDLDYADSRFYYFQKDSHSVLNTDKPSPVSRKHFPSLLYTFSYFVDWMVYLPKGPFFKITGRFCRFSSDKKFWYRFVWVQEMFSKGLLYGCTMCGDCVLYACGFLCYRSGCPKKMVNGPCGGSINGFCEVHPEKKKCYWIKVYRQLKGVSQHVTYTAPPIPARDNALNKTSSWINFFMGRDHRRLQFEDD
jgi:methylenetetrahydrofolate reductase (NADPH)